MKNIETPDKKHLGAFISKLSEGNFIIPDFQREFEWQPWDVEELLESIFKDYYIGTILLWHAGKENITSLSCESIYGFTGKAEPEHIVLDGQQRLTALYYAFFAPKIKFPKRKNRYFYFLRIDELLNENFDEVVFYDYDKKSIVKLLDNREDQYARKIFPLSIFGGKSYEWVKWVEGYEKYWQNKIGEQYAKDERSKIENFIKQLIDTYDISYIELDRNMDIAKVCDIFTKINSTGQDLNIFDLLNAILRPKKIFLKKLWREAKDSLEVVEAKHILQSMSILKQRYCAPRYLYYLVPGSEKVIKLSDGSLDKIVLIEENDEFIKLWKSVVKEMAQVIERLKNPRDYGAIIGKFIPYPAMIPILTALYVYIGNKNYLDMRDIEHKMKRWYWSSILTKNYSSAVESKMTRDFSELINWFDDNNSIPRIISQCLLEFTNLHLKDEIKQNSAIYKSIFNLLVIKGAKDFQSFQLPEYSLLHDHHIVPQSWGKDIIGNGIDTILNRTPLSDKTNRDVISNKLPNEYIKKMFDDSKNEEEVYELLESHLISRKAVDILLRNNFKKEDFDEFIKERERVVLDELKRLLQLDSVKQETMIEPGKPFTNRMLLESILRSCNDYIYWVDKFYSKVGLDIIASTFNSQDDTNVKKIRILTSDKTIDDSFRNGFLALKRELKNKGIDIEMRIVIKSKLKKSIHDRWIISNGKIFNIPSTDTISSGKYSEIKETKNSPPFNNWWDEGLDIINNWDQINMNSKILK
jgi:hypothetical protein